MPFSIQPVQVDDAPGLANTADSAFAHDSHWALGWSKDTQLVERVSYSTQRYPWRLIRPESDNQRHQKVVDASTGEVVSYAKWELLNMDDDDLWSEARVDKSSLGPLDFKMYKDMYARADPVAPNDEGADFDTMEWISQKSMIIDVPCLAIVYLATHPSYQRRGCGTLLLKQGLAVADEAGLMVVVMSTPSGVPLFEKFGFQMRREYNYNYESRGGTGIYTLYCMIRLPVKAAEVGQ